MNSRTFLVALAIVCLVAMVSAQSSAANPMSSLQQKASSVAASATNTAAPSPTQSSAAVSLTSSPVILQVLVLACAFVASSYLI
ncbi:hypothetical protein INT47_009954 [Mucor saturninus]|uniref:Uncharacterized protein n=1 Tax=Mucor saturninus TaxID=64648 RepID=A0A8H7QX77_9FUNG|nr:hypothetical protein INT47_009954 [Mucor saturninus]